VTQFEFLLLLAAVILGLAISDLAVSIHRLLAAGSRVKWDWLAPLAALVAFLKIVTQWWAWYGEEKIAGALTFEMFLGVLSSAVLLFLLTAAALPDDFGERPVDLRAYYAAVSRRYWLLFVAHFVLVNIVSVWAQVVIDRSRFDLIQPGWLVLPVALSFVFIRNRWWHTVGLAAFTAF
jgi:hypothetical protein